ncbi:MAG: hypothetical protein ACRDL1_06590 [Solirubrobacterales bacterium]
MGRRIRDSRHSPAIVVAALALVAALAGTAVAGQDEATSAIGKKKVKKIVKKEVAKQIASLPEGPPGPPGEDAANLFAYVKDDLPTGNANLLYGRGATAVDDPAGPDEDYAVTFNRSLRNCVAHANVGFGDPGGGGSAQISAVATVSLSSGPANELQVAVQKPPALESVDSSFMVSVFC